MNAIRCRGKDRGHAFGPGCSKAHRELRAANLAAMARDIDARSPVGDAFGPIQPHAIFGLMPPPHSDIDPSDACAARAAQEMRDAHPLR